MPINIPDGLPAKQILHQERIFALEEEVAETQQIRPLRVAILNLMPTKVETETQILRLISKSPLQVSCDFMRVSSHESTHVSADHLVKFYDTFDAFRDKFYDGLIVTGAPVEHMAFEDVDYWDEFCEIVDWSQTHVFSTMFLCWGALGALWHLYQIPKRQLGAKLFGVFQQRLCDEYNFLTNGFDEVHYMPPSTRRSSPSILSCMFSQRALRAAPHFWPRATSTRSTSRATLSTAATPWPTSSGATSTRAFPFACPRTTSPTTIRRSSPSSRGARMPTCCTATGSTGSTR